MDVYVTVRAIVNVPDDKDLYALAAEIKSQGLGPEDVITIENVIVTGPNGIDAEA